MRLLPLGGFQLIGSRGTGNNPWKAISSYFITGDVQLLFLGGSIVRRVPILFFIHHPYSLSSLKFTCVACILPSLGDSYPPNFGSIRPITQ